MIKYFLITGLLFPTEESPLQVISYPIEDTRSIIQLFKDEKVPIFVYGSLLNPESARRTIPGVEPASGGLIFGAVKIFDRHMPEALHWGVPNRPNDTAMLNLYLTGEVSDFTNGALIYVDENQLKALIVREKGYDLYPVTVYPQCVFAYAFVAQREEEFLSRKINPVPKYYQVTKQGAALYGNAFLNIWIATTLLSDRKTPLIEWVKNPDLDMGD